MRHQSCLACSCWKLLTRAPYSHLLRAGESEYNQSGLLGGDSSITDAGKRYAQALPALLASRMLQVWAHHVSSQMHDVEAAWNTSCHRLIFHLVDNYRARMQRIVTTIS